MRREGKIAFVDEVREREPREGEDRPGVQSEVVEGEAHRLSGCLLGVALDAHLRASRRGVEVEGRLRNGPEHENGADAYCEEHPEPRQIRVLRLLLIGAQLQTPEPTHADVDEEEQEYGDAQDEEPSEVLEDPRRRGTPGLPI